MILDSLSQATTAATTLSNLILVSPQKVVGYQPQNFPTYIKDQQEAPPTLLFHLEEENTVQLQSDVTDHFVENNTAIQDQVALRPVIVTVNGFIGELNDIAPKALQPLKTIAQKLVGISAFTPQLSESALRSYNQAAFVYNVAAGAASSVISSWDSINGEGGLSVINSEGLQTERNQTKQQIAFQQFYGYWKNRTLFTVQTPWAVFQDMVILSVRAVQDADTKMISNFEVQFKQMLFASSQVIQASKYNANTSQGRASSQGANEIDMGTQTLQSEGDLTSMVGGG